MGKMSINKGSSFEREIAKRLSDWSGVSLVRTPMSGAWQGCDADIWPKDPTIPFCLAIECKRIAVFDFHAAMAGMGMFYDWVDQTQSQVTNNKLPMLIFKPDYKPIYIAVPAYSVCGIEFPAHFSALVHGINWWTVVEIEKFLGRVRYKDLQVYCEPRYFVDPKVSDGH